MGTSAEGDLPGEPDSNREIAGFDGCPHGCGTFWKFTIRPNWARDLFVSSMIEIWFVMGRLLESMEIVERCDVGTILI